MYELATQGAPDLLLRLQKNSGPKIIIISECHESPSDQVPYLSTCNIGCSFRSADPPPTQHVLRTRHSSTDHPHLTIVQQCSILNRMDGWMDGVGTRNSFLVVVSYVLSIHMHPPIYQPPSASPTYTVTHLHFLLTFPYDAFTYLHTTRTIASSTFSSLNTIIQLNAASTQVFQIINQFADFMSTTQRIFLYFLTHSLISFAKFFSLKKNCKRISTFLQIIQLVLKLPRHF